MKEAGAMRVRKSILRRQNTVAQFIATRTILGLCEVAERRRGDTGPTEMVGTDGCCLEVGQGEGSGAGKREQGRAGDDVIGSGLRDRNLGRH